MPAPIFDLRPYAQQLGNPADYFVDHEGRDEPLVVRHSDGQPEFIMGSDGTLRPFRQEPNPEAPPIRAGFGGKLA